MFFGTALSTCSKTRIKCKVYIFNVVIADVLVTGTTGAFILSGTVITSETVMYVDAALPKKGNIMQNLHFVML